MKFKDNVSDAPAYFTEPCAYFPSDDILEDSTSEDGHDIDFSVPQISRGIGDLDNEIEIDNSYSHFDPPASRYTSTSTSNA